MQPDAGRRGLLALDSRESWVPPGHHKNSDHIFSAIAGGQLLSKPRMPAQRYGFIERWTEHDDAGRTTARVGARPAAGAEVDCELCELGPDGQFAVPVGQGTRSRRR